MNAYIAFFLIAGALFGVATFPIRHFFSEGPHAPEAALHPPTFISRAFWVMVCTFLWPIMLLTGMNSAWILTKRKRERRFSDT